MTTDMANITQTFGSKVRARREQLGLSQSDLAELLECSQPNISELEKGNHSPSLSTVERIAKALEVTVEYFFKSRRNSA